MDNGAHFYRCDFQVHTPRDINWTGTRPTTDADRRDYAERFIRTCRQKGLGAVAITDHHDAAFFNFIRKAAEDEVDDQGNPIPPQQRIVVFPGMELTLGVPCQALLLLDANLPAHVFASLPMIFAVNQADASQAIHAQTVRLENFTTFGQLHDFLDQHEVFRGHYIIFPNVSEGGNSTMLRTGFANRYKEMPCVGGYLDGNLGQLGVGNKTILSGKNRDYGFKSLGLFQTSDNRREDFRDLGAHGTWVKWAVPTAEALRQACLAKQTRISQTEPVIPSVVIESVTISNSRFLGPVNLDFNPQFNCLIGGRGTGKSTILEYLRWALCDQIPVLDDESELPDYQNKRANLIEKTLVPFDGVVTVVFSVNNVPHTVKKNSRSKEIQLKVAASDFRACSEAEIRNLLPIQAYSQKQLSAVGVRNEELDRFIRAEVRGRLTEFANRERDLKSQLQSTYAELRAKVNLQVQIDRDDREIESLNQQARALRDELKGLSDDDRVIITQHDQYLQEEEQLTRLAANLERAREVVGGSIQNLESVSSEAPPPNTTPNGELVHQFEQRTEAVLGEVVQLLSQALDLLNPSSVKISELQNLRATWQARFVEHNAKYEAAKSRASSHESRLKQITALEEQIRQKRTALAEKKSQVARYGNPDIEYQRTREAWKGLYSERADLLSAKCNELTLLSSGAIRARLERGAGLGKIRERFELILSGTRIRTKKAEDLCAQVLAADDRISKWNQIAEELESLAKMDKSAEGPLTLPECHLLLEAGFTVADLDKLARKISQDDWLQLFLTELDDLPVFEYRQAENEYIKFSDASAGQQATALLRVLLNQGGPPLVIDQPEDDLDNQVILQIVEDIWSAKERRQIIFTSHNANIVVNGDADLVVCCDYRAAGDQSGGRIKCRGAIDVDEIRTEIKTVMEGGESAFNLRKQKYGF
jgi:chromosome segregation protein